MPVILKIEHEDGQRTVVWEIKEDESALLNMASLNKVDSTLFSLITNPGRQLEWLAVRALLRDCYLSTPTINYLENGKPLLVNHADKISISHSGNMVGIALHSVNNPGIDIEKIHPRIFKIAGRFLNETEKEFLGANPSAEQLTILWGAKEVMYKVYGHGGLTFKNDIMIKPFTLSTKGILEGIIHQGKIILAIAMEYIKIGDFILVQTDYGRNFGKNTDL